MSNLYPVAGCHIFIGGVLNPGIVDLTETDFDGQSWLEIDGWNQMGTFGDTAQLITTPIINRGRDTKQKGTTNAGSMENVFAIIQDDPGQLALLAAAAGAVKDNFAFKVEFNDAPESGPAPEPTIAYFTALAMSTQEAGGDANTVRNMNATLEINSNIVMVPATDGS